MPQEVDQTEARQGETPGVTRYVLAISLPLAIATLAILYFWYF